MIIPTMTAAPCKRCWVSAKEHFAGFLETLLPSDIFHRHSQVLSASTCYLEFMEP